MPKCSVCGVDMADKPLYRSNPKGQPAIWKCEDCIEKPDSDLKELVDIIHKGERHE